VQEEDIESIKDPGKRDIADKYIEQHKDAITGRIEVKTLTRPRMAAFKYTKEGLLMNDLNAATAHYIDYQQEQAYRLAQEYLKINCHKKRTDFLDQLPHPSNKHRPLAQALFWDIWEHIHANSTYSVAKS
jgi:hypothetical protein